MERLKSMKEQLMSAAQSQMGNLQNVDAEELGEVVDMIKDLEEAIYYCTITEAMNKKEEKGQDHHYYTERVVYQPSGHMDSRYYGDGSERYMPYDRYYRDMDKDYGRMYYNGGSNSSSSGGNSSSSNSGGMSSRNYTERMLPLEMRDSREGRSPMSRKSYIEAKEMHKDKASQLKELENYVSELSKDLVDMIEDASPEEQQFLERKISQLATKIGHINHA